MSKYFRAMTFPETAKWSYTLFYLPTRGTSFPVAIFTPFDAIVAPDLRKMDIVTL